MGRQDVLVTSMAIREARLLGGLCLVSERGLMPMSAGLRAVSLMGVSLDT